MCILHKYRIVIYIYVDLFIKSEFVRLSECMCLNDWSVPRASALYIAVVVLAVPVAPFRLPTIHGVGDRKCMYVCI